VQILTYLPSLTPRHRNHLIVSISHLEDFVHKTNYEQRYPHRAIGSKALNGARSIRARNRNSPHENPSTFPFSSSSGVIVKDTWMACGVLPKTNGSRVEAGRRGP
jgi:hypothetical protein